MTDTMPEQGETDWSDVEQGADGASYPSFPENPHNHLYTVSMDGRGPMIVVRGNTPAELNERYQALMDAGTTTIAASVYSHMKAEMGVAQGLGPVSPAPAPAGPPMPPQGAVPPPFGPNVSVPGAPGYQGPPGMPQYGAPTPPPPPPAQGGGNGRAEPKPRPAWPQVYRISIARGDTSFKEYRAANQQYFKGKVNWAGGGDYWIHGDVVQGVAQWNPVPA